MKLLEAIRRLLGLREPPPAPRVINADMQTISDGVQEWRRLAVRADTDGDAALGLISASRWLNPDDVPTGPHDASRLVLADEEEGC